MFDPSLLQGEIPSEPAADRDAAQHLVPPGEKEAHRHTETHHHSNPRPTQAPKSAPHSRQGEPPTLYVTRRIETRIKSKSEREEKGSCRVLFELFAKKLHFVKV